MSLTNALLALDPAAPLGAGSPPQGIDSAAPFCGLLNFLLGDAAEQPTSSDETAAERTTTPTDFLTLGRPLGPAHKQPTLPESRDVGAGKESLRFVPLQPQVAPPPLAAFQKQPGPSDPGHVAKTVAPVPASETEKAEGTSAPPRIAPAAEKPVGKPRRPAPPKEVAAPAATAPIEDSAEPPRAPSPPPKKRTNAPDRAVPAKQPAPKTSPAPEPPQPIAVEVPAPDPSPDTESDSVEHSRPNAPSQPAPSRAQQLLSDAAIPGTEPRRRAITPAGEVAFHAKVLEKAAPEGQQKSAVDPPSMRREPITAVEHPREHTTAATRPQSDSRPAVTPSTDISPNPVIDAAPKPRTETIAAVKEPSEARPAAPVEHEPETAAPRKPNNIQVELTGVGQRVQLRVEDRGGELRVAVHTPDSRLAGALREDLPALTAKLEQSGFHAEFWHGGSAAAVREIAADAKTSAGEQQFQDRHGGQSRDQEQQAPRPKQDIEEQTKSKSERKDFSWLFTSIT